MNNKLSATVKAQTENDLRNQAIIEALPIPMALNDEQGNITYLNPAFVQTLGYRLAEIPTLADWWPRAYPNLAYQQWVIESWQSYLAEAKLNNKASMPMEFNITCKDSTVRTFAITASPLADNFAGIYLVTLYDVTAQKHAENELISTKTKLEAALASMSDAVYISDTEGRFIHFNEAFATFHKFKNKAECLKTLSEYPALFDVYSMSGEFLPLEQRPVSKALQGETGTNAEFLLRRKDTGTKWFGSYNYAPIRNTHGEFIGTVVVAHDITERKQQQFILAASEIRYRSLFNNMAEGLAYCQMLYENGIPQDFIYLEVNAAFAKLTKLTDVAGKKVSEIIPGIRESDPALFDLLSNVALTGKSNHFEIYLNSLETWFSLSVYSPETYYFVAIFEVITERKKVEESLIASEKEFHLLAESMPQIVWITDTEGRSIYINQQWVDYTGLSLEESYGLNWSKPFHPDDQQRAWDTWKNAVIQERGYSNECRLRRADGIYRWWLIRGVPVWDEQGKIYKWFGTCTDIQELKETEQALRDNETRLKFALRVGKTGAWDLNLADYTARCTLEHAHIFGYEAPVPQWTYQMFLEHVIPEDRSEVDRIVKNAIATQTSFSFECQIHRTDGELRWIQGAGEPLADESGLKTRIAGIVQDITERKKNEEAIYDLAYHDPLTRLPNRRLMLDRLKQILISRALKTHHGAVLLINLNNFRSLNDSKGHNVGDLLLIAITAHLQAIVHQDDTVARIGGDEFVLLLQPLDETITLAASQAEAVAKRVLDSIGQPFDLQGYEYRCSASIGICLFRGEEITVDAVVKQADMAMHQAKQLGQNSICFFEPAIQVALEYRVHLESLLRKALNNQYRLYYQVQVDGEGKATGAEALIRWHHPEYGIISPLDFIPLAEKTGLILPIGHWVLETACLQLKAWEKNADTRQLILAVNVSARQFHQADFAEQVLAVLAQTGANPDKLKLELTESMLVDNVENIIEKMNRLKSAGVKFSLDDFGTGFSSLT